MECMFRSKEEAQGVEVLAAKPDDPSSDARRHMIERES